MKRVQSRNNYRLRRIFVEVPTNFPIVIVQSKHSTSNPKVVTSAFSLFGLILFGRVLLRSGSVVLGEVWASSDLFGSVRMDLVKSIVQSYLDGLD